MGLFSYVLHPTDGCRMQVRFGGDDLATYHLHDRLPQRPDPNWPGDGVFMDGVYQAYRDQTQTGRQNETSWRNEFWVVVAGGVLTQVLSAQDEQAVCCARNAVRPPPRSWWSRDAWLRHDLRHSIEQYRRAVSALRRQAERRSETAEPAMAEGFTALGEVMGDLIAARLEEPSLMERVLTQRPLHPLENVAFGLERAVATAAAADWLLGADDRFSRRGARYRRSGTELLRPAMAAETCGCCGVVLHTTIVGYDEGTDEPYRAPAPDRHRIVFCSRCAETALLMRCCGDPTVSPFRVAETLDRLDSERVLVRRSRQRAA